MKTMTCVMLMIIGFSGAAFATNQNHSQSTQEPIRLALNQCVKGSDCGPYAKCCNTKQGTRCLSVAACP